MLTPSDDADLHLQAAPNSHDESMPVDLESIEQRLLTMRAVWSNSTAAERLAAYARDLPPQPVGLDTATITHDLHAWNAQTKLVGNAQPGESYRKQKGSHTMKTISTSPADYAKGSPPPYRSTPSRLTTVAAVLITGVLVTGALLGFLSLRARQTATKQQHHLAISTGTLHCSSAPFTSLALAQPALLDWSARGDIAMSYPVKIFNADTCAREPLAQGIDNDLTTGIWSPDGTRLLLVTADGAQVLDAATGQHLVSLQSNDSYQTIGSAAWTADGTQIVGAVFHSSVATIGNQEVRSSSLSWKVKVWDSRTGDLLQTGFSFDPHLIASGWVSPNGTYVAVQPLAPDPAEVWNTATGQEVSTLPSGIRLGPEPFVWSPDGTLLAVAIDSPNWPAVPAEVQVWSTISGKLVATLTDTTSDHGFLSSAGLAWSPSGQYLAEGSQQITIWDTTTWREVATFAKVAAPTPVDGGALTHYSLIDNLGWSPDGTMLASVTQSYDAGPSSGGPASNLSSVLDVWQLS